jgi:hypothetical protein
MTPDRRNPIRIRGYKYIGDYFREKPHGRGCIFRADGSLYFEGEWKLGKQHGLGKLFRQPTPKVEHLLFYEGEWVQGEWCGFGKLYHENGVPEYAGMWKVSRRDGYGIEMTPDGEVRYEGYWADNKYHGPGKLFHMLD